MFGVSFGEVVLVAAVALIVMGPRRLPEMLGKLGQWVGHLRRMATEMRRQTGIDEILRQEGLPGGINELRSMMRGENPLISSGAASGHRAAPNAVVDVYGEAVEFDRFRECPVEGPDCGDAIPEDLVPPVASPASAGPAAAASAPTSSATSPGPGTAQ